DARLAALEALCDELHADGGLARSGRTGQEHALALGDAAAEHFIELRNADRNTALTLDVPRMLAETEGARKALHAVVGEAEGVQTGHGVLPAELHNLELSHD